MEKPSVKIKIKNVLKAINEFDKSIEKCYKTISSSNEIIRQEGYFINKKLLDDIKVKANYQIYKNMPHDSNEKISKEKINDDDYIQLDIYKQRSFKTSEDLKKALYDNNEYYIINDDILKNIYNEKFNEKKGKILFEINKDYLILFLNNNKDILLFKHNHNIINKQSLINERNIFK